MQGQVPCGEQHICSATPNQSRQSGLLAPEPPPQGALDFHEFDIGVLAEFLSKARTERDCCLHVRPDGQVRHHVANVSEPATRAGGEGVDEQSHHWVGAPLIMRSPHGLTVGPPFAISTRLR